MSLFKELVVEEKVLSAEILEEKDGMPALRVDAKLKSNAAWRDMAKRWTKRNSDEIDQQKMASIYAEEVIAEAGRTEDGKAVLAVSGLTLDNLYRLIPGAKLPAEALQTFRSLGAHGLKVTREDFRDLFLSAQGTFAIPIMRKIDEETKEYGETQAREEAATRKNSSAGRVLPSD